MHSVAAAWLMTTLTPSPLMAALVQSAGTLPLFLFCLPAGAYADLVDRRKLLIVTQAAMLVVALGIGILTLTGHTGPLTLLTLTFAMGCAAAWNAPAWSASIPSLIDRESLPGALTLNSVQFNAARAVGPAIGGALLIAASPGVVFLINAVSFLAVIGVIRNWKSTPRLSGSDQHEGLAPFMLEGIRFVRNDPAMRKVVRRTTIFGGCGSAMWAILPSVARHLLHTSSAGFGTMLGALGIGAVIAGILLARGREQYREGLLIAVGSLGFALSLSALAVCTSLSPFAYGLLLIGGISWMTAMSTLNIAAQKALPDWVRARGLSIHILVFNGALAFGGWLWGQVAEHFGVQPALWAAAAGLVVLLPFSLRGYTGIK
jgi:predicted MFS family arabinose efflux permease